MINDEIKPAPKEVGQAMIEILAAVSVERRNEKLVLL